MGFEAAVNYILIGVVAFFCEYADSTLGMGYGTTLTPVLLIIGLGPGEVVPAILFSELISGLLAGFLHHREGNVDFKPKIIDVFTIGDVLRPLQSYHKLRMALPMDLKVALLLATTSIIGTVSAVFVALSIPKFYLKLYIGVLVLSMGVLILLLFNRQFKFSKKKIFGLGVVASFNKGISGGGYGPVITCGQILSGIESRNAIGITSLAEGLTCFVGFFLYVLMAGEAINWALAGAACIGAVLSVPLSARSVKYIKPGVLKVGIAILTIVLGTLTIVKCF